MFYTRLSSSGSINGATEEKCICNPDWKYGCISILSLASGKVSLVLLDIKEGKHFQINGKLMDLDLGLVFRNIIAFWLRQEPKESRYLCVRPCDILQKKTQKEQASMQTCKKHASKQEHASMKAL